MRSLVLLSVFFITGADAAASVTLPTWLSSKNTNTSAPGTRSQTQSPVENLQKQNNFDGSKLALGYVANTGNTNSRNVDVGGVLNYTHARWNLNELTTYERQQDSTEGVTEDKFYTQGRAQFAINVRDYMYLQTSYLTNQFDGYVYVYNENLGYGHYIPVPPTMSFDIFVGPGLRQSREIASAGGEFTNQADMQVGTEYLWDFSNNATFNFNIQTEAASANTHTEANAGVTSFIAKHLALNVNYDVGYDSKPVADKKAVNTTTTMQVLYHF